MNIASSGCSWPASGSNHSLPNTYAKQMANTIVRSGLTQRGMRKLLRRLGERELSRSSFTLLGRQADESPFPAGTPRLKTDASRFSGAAMRLGYH